MKFKNVTLLSDLGMADGSVGVLHSIVRALCPEVGLVDLSHEVTPYAINEAGLVLARATPYLLPGVVLVAVDPGSSRLVIVEVGGGQSYLVGPDNGVLASAVALVGGATAAFEISDPSVGLAVEGTRSQSRDLLAPVVGKLCSGVEVTELGEPIETSSLVPGIMSVAETDDEGRVTGEVLWVDRFGNLHLNIESQHLEGQDKLGLSIDQVDRILPVVPDLAKLGRGELVLAPNSHGLVSVAARSDSAASLLGCETGTVVSLTPEGLAAPTVESNEVEVEFKL